MFWIELWAMIQVIGMLIPIAIFVLILLVLIFKAAWDGIKQSRCKHENYYETRACDAICKECGKNLGFIGTVRRERAKK